MTKIKKVTFLWKEGPSEEADALPVSVDSLKDADLVLFKWASKAPKDGSYYKVGFELMWQDGASYQGRLDLTWHDSLGSNILGKHIRSVLAYTGRKNLVNGYQIDAEKS